MLNILKNSLKLQEQGIKFIKKNYLLLGIFLLGIILRFWNTPARYNFGSDSTRDALVAVSGATHLHFPLVGPFSSVGPFTFGPWYYYQLIIFQKLFPLSYSAWLYMGLASLLTIFIMYKVGEQTIDKNFGILLAILCAISPAYVLSSMGLTNPNLIPLFAALVILFYVNICARKVSHWYGFFLGFFLGIGISIHYQMLGMLLLPVIAIIFHKEKYKYFLLTLLGVLVASLPTIVFELGHNWHTTTNFIASYVSMKERIYVPNSWTLYLQDFWPSFWGYVLSLPKIIALIIMPLALFMSTIFAVKKEKKKILLPLILFFILSFISLRYYPGERSYGYLQFYYPFILIFTGVAINYAASFKGKKIIILISIVIIFLFGIRKNIMMAETDKTGKLFRAQADVIISNTKNHAVSLYDCELDTYRYRTEAIVILLDNKKKIQDSGRKIALISTKCPLAISVFKDKKLHKLTGIDAFFINDKQAKKLTTLGYKKITPETIYITTVDWWK